MNYLDVNVNHGEEDYELNFHTTDYNEFSRVFELCQNLVNTRDIGHKIMVSDKKIRKAMEVLNKEYERACKLDYVNDPLAFALYQTWHKYDSYYKERCVKNE